MSGAGRSLMALAALAASVAAGCGEDCRADKTATLRLENAALVPMHFLIDGADEGLVQPGGSLTRTVAAESRHSVIAQWEDGRLACKEYSANEVLCTTSPLKCGCVGGATCDFTR